MDSIISVRIKLPSSPFFTEVYYIVVNCTVIFNLYLQLIRLAGLGIPVFFVASGSGGGSDGASQTSYKR